MAAITPQTDVYILKVPLEIDNENQLTFANATAQFNYFNGLTNKIALDNFTYQRKDGVIRVPYNIDDIINYNYVMYRNEGFSNKWFYAYITGMEFINPSTTAVSIKTDTFQTWQFDLTYKDCFVEREHVNDDTIGKNTVPEGLEVGEYEIVDLKNIPIYETLTPSTDWTVCFVTGKLPDGLKTFNYESDLLGGVFNAQHIFAVGNIEQARTLLYIYNEEGRQVVGDDIKNMYMVPTACVNKENNQHTTLSTTIDGQTKVAVLYPLYNAVTLDNDGYPFELKQPNVMAEAYQPVNKKLYTYPFSYFYVTNKAGTDVTYRWEDFPVNTAGQYDTGVTLKYEKAIVPTVSLSAKMYFTNYKTYSQGASLSTRMYNYGVNFAKTPVCSWTTDYYTNWLTQNGVNIGADVAKAGLTGIAAGIGLAKYAGAAGILAGGIGGLVVGVSTALQQVHNASLTPNQTQGDLNSSDVMYGFTRCAISLYMMSIRKEYAQIIDKYFSAFGYKVNLVKKPNVTGRTNWNYVKTIGCYIAADIPQEDLQEIKNMFDNGVTFWHNASTFRDYTQSNGIVTP